MHLTAAVCTLILTTHMVNSTHPECSVVHYLLREETKCKNRMNNVTLLRHFRNKTTGCVMDWDGVTCWPAASAGETISVQCPQLPLLTQNPTGEQYKVLISRVCTVDGWSEPSLPYYKACYHDDDDPDEEIRKQKNYFDTVRLLYSVGYGLSLATLLVALLIFCTFRKLHCTRNHIHLNLFVTFMLRSLAVFIKDAVLFADHSLDHCTMSTAQCKAAVTFFHFCVLSNFSWLLVEALYLQSLLLFPFTRTRTFCWIYATVGWGAPTVITVIWALMKKEMDDEACWDDLESRLWWIIKTPILLSIFINFLIFVNISRTIVQKTKATHRHQTDTQLYRTLLHSTLVLIPLFGLHYVVFAMFPEHVSVGPRLYLELVLGSFQGFIVAVMYCFLNGEVQNEIQTLMRSFRTERNTVVIHLQTLEDVS